MLTYCTLLYTEYRYTVYYNTTIMKTFFFILSICSTIYSYLTNVIFSECNYVIF